MSRNFLKSASIQIYIFMLCRVFFVRFMKIVLRARNSNFAKIFGKLATLVFLKRPSGYVTGIYNTSVYCSFPLNCKVTRRMQSNATCTIALLCQRSCLRFSTLRILVADIMFRKIPWSFLLYMSYLSLTCALRTQESVPRELYNRTQ